MPTTEIEWWNLKARELRDLAARDAVVLIPVGSTEQHGPHLPVQVDALLVGEVARRAARLVTAEQPIVVAPTIWTGLAEHHMPFGGTFTLDFATFLGLIRCICRSAARHGFRRMFLLNGHGGNMTALDTVVTELSVELQLPIAAGTYWMLAERQFGEILEAQANVLHACEAETSMVLALRPELVDASELDRIAGPPAEQFWTDFMRAPARWRTWEKVTANGVLGDPARASSEKGERLLAAAARAVADAVSAPALWK
jgi:creatinine amidohydrolase